MAQIDDVIDNLSPDEVAMLNSDPELLAAFKSKYAGPQDIGERGLPRFETPQDKAIAAKEPISAPFLSLASKTPALPVGGTLLAGPAGGAAGEGLRQMASIASGEPAPSPLESAARMIGAALVLPGAAGATNAAKNVARVGGNFLTPSIEESNAALMPILEKHGLKDIMPVVFNKGEREAAVAYAQNAAKNAENLTPQMLQEARSTLKDVLDNRIVQPTSPTGQIISRAKDAVTTALGKALPDVGEALGDLGESYAAEPTKRVGKALLGQAKRAAILGAVGTAVGAPIAAGIRKLIP